MRDDSKTVAVLNSELFGTLLTIAFIVLKLCGVIDWSWFWVLAPLWIPFAIVIVAIILIFIITYVMAFFS